MSFDARSKGQFGRFLQEKVSGVGKPSLNGRMYEVSPSAPKSVSVLGLVC
jgi:hypothetical protein